jgi:hypothetical protein
MAANPIPKIRSTNFANAAASLANIDPSYVVDVGSSHNNSSPYRADVARRSIGSVCIAMQTIPN